LTVAWILSLLTSARTKSEQARALAETHKHGEQLEGALSVEQKQSADLALAFEEEQVNAHRYQLQNKRSNITRDPCRDLHAVVDADDSAVGERNPL